MIEIVVEAARQTVARAALYSQWTRRRNGSLDVAVAALNETDTLRRGAPEKWREVNTRGGTLFRKSEKSLELPSAKTVCKTAFTRISNGGFDKNGHAVKCPDVVGDRWQGQMVGGDEDAAWVAPYDASVTEWLGEGGINWLATTSRTGTKEVVGTHALKEGVDRCGTDATTPEQRPLDCTPTRADQTLTCGGRARSVGRRATRNAHGAAGWDAASLLPRVRHGWRAGDRRAGCGRHVRVSGRLDPRRGGVPLAEHQDPLLHRLAVRA